MGKPIKRYHSSSVQSREFPNQFVHDEITTADLTGFITECACENHGELAPVCTYSACQIFEFCCIYCRLAMLECSALKFQS